MASLVVSIPDENSFYSLYSDGLFSRKTFVRELKSTLIEYANNSVVVLYYTYPTHREACLIRNASQENMVSLPGLSQKVSLIFSVHASRVDKLKRAVAFLHKHSHGAFSHPDPFYIRLAFIIKMRGKLNYPALKVLSEKQI